MTTQRIPREAQGSCSGGKSGEFCVPAGSKYFEAEESFDEMTVTKIVDLYKIEMYDLADF